MNLWNKVEAFCREHDLLPPGAKVLVALSGGIDSVVLTHLLRERQQPMALAHANFQLRGEESDGDEHFVRTLAQAWSLPLYTQRFDTRAYAEEQGISIQVAARQLRYQWFESLCDEDGWEYIATAHHLNDSIETALFHFSRGSGLSGVAGIPPRSGRVIRPLLSVTRDEIETYARAHGLTWREDKSNADLHYTRNALRHRVLPILEELFPDFVHRAGNTLHYLRAADANAQYLLRQLLQPSGEEGIFSISVEEIEALPAPADALFDLLQPYGFSAEQAQAMWRSRQSPGAEWSSKQGYRLVVGRQMWLLVTSSPSQESIRLHADDLMVRLPDNSRIFLTETQPNYVLSKDPHAVVVDAGRLRFPLLLRRWRSGDVFQPLGMGGKRQKLQDFFTNQKMSVIEKERVWILENADGQIIWVVGLRLSEPFKVTEKTSKVLKLTWIRN
ncbi:MAG: tRNA lysidine(34) synthetase TilS [Saprospiraceae bacterium]|nr:tRNA lysidine(34) synthetase TilS [Saprospiraceae bacterium]MDW8484218.1 tRNA lysidine(34) synthetase TilS [Saprospiraceae bacterium]